jgi:glycogen synthase
MLLKITAIWQSLVDEMKILFISDLCPPFYLGGYEIAAYNVAHALNTRGHTVRFLTSHCHLPIENSPPFVDRRLTLHWFTPCGVPNEETGHAALFASTCTDYSNTSSVLDTLRTFQPDVVYCWNIMGIGGLAIFDLLNTVGIPWVLHLMDRVPAFITDHVPEYVRHVFNGGGSALYKRAKIISMSEHLLREIKTVSGIKFEYATIIPGWVLHTNHYVRGEYQLSNITRFVAAGAVNQAKGTDLIIESVARLLEDGVDEFNVDIYGDGDIGSFVDLAMEKRCLHKINFLGSRPQTQLLKLYSEYDVFLFPTWKREPFGFAPIEAASAGCVPLITRNCGAAERLVDEVHCIKISRNVTDLTHKMRSIVEGRYDLFRIGQATASLVRSDLNFSRCLDSIEKVLISANSAWDRKAVYDTRLPLLLYAKHHLARSIQFGVEG